jgi:hypothetical protein
MTDVGRVPVISTEETEKSPKKDLNNGFIDLTYPPASVAIHAFRIGSALVDAYNNYLIYYITGRRLSLDVAWIAKNALPNVLMNGAVWNLVPWYSKMVTERTGLYLFFISSSSDIGSGPIFIPRLMSC